MITWLRRVVMILGLAVAAGAAGACATVQPWERAKLANPCMVFDANAQQTAFNNHWQASREGAAGGFGMQGGGCGCK